MKKYGLMPADILLPESGFEKWAVVACDQFTSEPSYWEEVERTVGKAPSALRVTLPEIYLGKDDDGAIKKINAAMNEYLDSGVLKHHENSMIYVERTQSDGRVRHGIVGVIDLEDYDYRSGSRSLIRATEATVTERIPPRVRIRSGAPIELPHVMLLADDPDGTVIAPLAAEKERFEKAYGFELMQGGGHIDGWFISPEAQVRIGEALDALVAGQDDRLLFAVGDGNHSLAAAKECYIRSGSEGARYALVEVVNIHDPAIEFEPIYRVLFGVEPERVIADFVADMGGEYRGDGAQVFECIFAGGSRTVSVKPSAKLPVGTLQAWLDRYLPAHGGKIDYIHGADTVRGLCTAEGTLGFIFDGMKKSELFDAIRADGSLPRKTFSMGHACDKRYYLEARPTDGVGVKL